MIEEKIIHIVTHQLRDVLAIYLFGSTGTPYEKADSDVDIAILRRPKIEMTERIDLINALIDILHKDKIDLIDLNKVPTVLKFQVILNGKRIYCANIYDCDSFEMYAFSDYVRLNEERRDILKEIQQRGSVL